MAWVLRFAAGLYLSVGLVTGSLHAQADVERRLSDLERRLNKAEAQVNESERQARDAERQARNAEAQAKKALDDAASFGGFAFLYGVFCALWAQNSGRSAWLWFFLGLLFSVFTVIVLLAKNANDRKRP